MRYLIVAMGLALSMASAVAQVSLGISMPGVSIGINVPTYPQLVRVPGYPVYYAPGMRANFFFYDGMYWVYQADNWYASSWYNGPWELVQPELVPVFVLRVPVRYYRNPPQYFRGWRPEAPPRWGDHWGRDWEQHHSGWDHWDRRAAPAPAPLPLYQRQYSGNRYPRAEQQPVLRARNYRYQPRDAIVQQRFQQQAVHPSPAPAAGPRAHQQPPAQRPEPQAARPAPGRQQERSGAQEPARQPRQEAPQSDRRAPGAASHEAAQGRAAAREDARGKGQEKDRKERGKGDEERGQDNKR